jgi:hypothetical protein
LLYPNRILFLAAKLNKKFLFDLTGIDHNFVEIFDSQHLSGEVYIYKTLVKDLPLHRFD